MKKRILLSLLIFTSQSFGVQYKNNNINVFSELLIWQVREGGDDNWGQQIGPVAKNQQVQLLDVPFKWNPGFRIGIGYDAKENPWNILLYYTWYKTQGTSQASTTTDEIHSAFLGNFYANNTDGAGLSGPFYHQAGLQWDILFNTLDLEFGRNINIQQLLNIRPFLGIKAGLINQAINTSWQTPFTKDALSGAITPITTFSSATEDVTNNFKGIGPSAGLDTTWHLFETSKHSFNLIGNASGAILWGAWTLTDVYHNNTPLSSTIMNDSLSTAASMARGYLGVEWTGVFMNSDLNFRLGYEGQVWFNQMRYYSFDMGKQNAPLMLQGGVLDVCIHF